jgi:hypothetical protein
MNVQKGGGEGGMRVTGINAIVISGNKVRIK